MATKARTYAGTPGNLAFLARRLKAGEIVAVPTETVYGLAGDATSAEACLKIFAAKGRPTDDPLIVHIAALRDLERVALANPEARLLARAFWPGPLTLVLPKTPLVPDLATAGLPSVAVRMPSHPLFRKLIRLSGVPLAAPSANPFGYVSPTSAAHVAKHLGRRIRYILDGGSSSIGLESTIVDLRNPRRPVLLRPGAITRDELGRVLGVTVARRRASGAGARVAPGQMARHYSPRTRVVLHAGLTFTQAAHGAHNAAWLFIGKPAVLGTIPANIFWLDPIGYLRRAARRLFSVLRELDEGGFSAIHVERPKGGGIAEALLDRLARAASR